ncbi:ABC transporter permease [Kitasatospora viridis]|uniref:ABC-2 family transporter n=1 Tax=Kitasatospora viridis TaxID=281105 RepID=A0A561TTZ2_9ACTN|nr:ABC transporter permease [Kitasatospora viridis]TWF90544.1 ABC-2 family transporter [Kitasatospora viridis]
MTTTTTTTTIPTTLFRHLLASEWLKFWSLRSMRWLLGLSALLILLLNLKAAQYSYAHFSPHDLDHGFAQVALDDSFGALPVTLLMFVAGGVGTLVIAGEFSSGMIRGTLAAVPDRRALLAAKACVLGAVMLGYGGLCSGLSFWLAQAVLAGRHAGMSITDPGALRFVLAVALFAPVCALAGLCTGVLVRHAAAAVLCSVLLLFLVPSLFSERYSWSAGIAHLLPLNALHRLMLVSLADTAPSPHPASVAGSWLAFALWAVGTVVVGAAVLNRRDL